MSDLLLGLVSSWGALALALITFLSCLAVPVPSSLAMLAAGAFVASGDLSLLPVSGAALAGAVLGDQAGYGLGRLAGAGAQGWIRRSPRGAVTFEQARGALHRRGATTVFLTRWLFSVLGPYVNLLAGAGGLGWLRFTLAGTAGEVIWVGAYISLGYGAAGQIEQVGALVGNASGLVASLALAVGLGWALWRRRRQA